MANAAFSERQHANNPRAVAAREMYTSTRGKAARQERARWREDERIWLAKLNETFDWSDFDCIHDISHNHEVGENWFCPIDLPEAHLG